MNYSNTNLGARSKNPRKYLQDAEILEKELQTDPANSRNQFYLAKSYLLAKEFPSALMHFEKRARMEGEKEEKFLALYLTARIQQWLNVSPDIFIPRYLQAHHLCPVRAEPLFYLADYYLYAKQYELAYETLKRIPTQADSSLFSIETAIYDWKLSYAIAQACLHLKKWQELETCFEQVLAANNVPMNILEETRKNLFILKNQ